MNTILSKWYFDAVTSEGEVIIGYEARLKLFGFNFSYSGLQYSKHDGTQKEYSSWKSGNGPHFENGIIRWCPNRCDSAFEWYDCTSGCNMLLYKDYACSFQWNCITPRALFKGHIGNYSLTGIGYIERMDMHLSSMQLPFKELLWGRAHIGNDSIVWISWKWGIERTWIWHNGQIINGILIGDMPKEIHFNDNIYSLKQIKQLRNRPVHKALKGFVRLLSGSISAAQEEKVLGDIIHTSSGKTGKAIYERVIWE